MADYADEERVAQEDREVSDRRDNRGYDRGDRDRSVSPRRASRSPQLRDNNEDRRGVRRDSRGDAAENQGTNLFVTGIAPRIDEAELRELFSKYGNVDNVQIMADPHTKESRGFGFVSMSTGDEAEAAREGLTGEEKYGRVMSVEKARRSRPRTPTPGKYFGPPKRDDPSRRPRGPPARYEERRYDRGGFGGDRYAPERRSYDRYDDRPSRYDDRGYGRRDERSYYRDRDPYARDPRDSRRDFVRDDYYSGSSRR